MSGTHPHCHLIKNESTPLYIVALFIVSSIKSHCVSWTWPRGISLTWNKLYKMANCNQFPKFSHGFSHVSYGISNIPNIPMVQIRRGTSHCHPSHRPRQWDKTHPLTADIRCGGWPWCFHHGFFNVQQWVIWVRVKNRVWIAPRWSVLWIGNAYVRCLIRTLS